MRTKIAALALVVMTSCGTVEAAPSGLLFYNGRSETEGYKIGVATGSGTSFTPLADPILGPGEWDTDHVKDPYVVQRDGRLFMYYAGHDGTRYSIGLATSADGFTWERRDTPIIDAGTDAWFPVVYGNHLWFGTPDGIVYASTTDGVSYEVHGVVLDGLLPGTVRKRSGVFRLFYSVRPQNAHPVGDEVHLATFADPLGDYRERGMLLEPTDDDSIYSGALTMRDIARTESGFIGYGTAFHFTEDLRELSIIFKAERLNGPWRICRPCGTLLPLDGEWDAIAAENPSVI